MTVAFNTTEIFHRWMTDLGDILALAEEAKVQGQYPLAIMRARVFPSLYLGQYLLLREQGKAVMFVNWAWLDDQVSERYEHRPCHLEPEQWRGGQHLWFMEMFGDGQYLQRLIHVMRQVFPNQTQVRWHEVDAVGSGIFRLRSVQFAKSLNRT